MQHDLQMELFIDYALTNNILHSCTSEGSYVVHVLTFICMYVRRSPQVKRSSLHSITLQHEDSEGVWNELTQYKTECETLRKRL